MDPIDNKLASVLVMAWIGLHLFNDDTRPSGHISRPGAKQATSHYLSH